MDTNILNLILISCVFLILLWVFDEGGILILLGFIIILTAFKFSLIFAALDSDLTYFFQIIFILISLFCFGKSMYMRKEVIHAE